MGFTGATSYTLWPRLPIVATVSPVDLSGKNTRFVFVGTAITVIVIDYASKWWIRRTIGPGAEREEIVIAGNIVRLRYSENSGIAFGLLNNQQTLVSVLLLLAVGIGGLFLWQLLPGSSSRVMLGAGLMAGGGLANVIDRVQDGVVTDFISFWRWPLFNVADAALSVGAIAIALLLYQSHASDGQNVQDSAKRTQ